MSLFLGVYSKQKIDLLTKVGSSCFLLSLYYVSYSMQCFCILVFYPNKILFTVDIPQILKLLRCPKHHFLKLNVNSFWWYFDIWLKKVLKIIELFSRKIRAKNFSAAMNYKSYSYPTNYETCFSKTIYLLRRKRYQSFENANIHTNRVIFHLLFSTRNYF